MELVFNYGDIKRILELYTGEECVNPDTYSKEEIVEIITMRASTKLLR